MYQATLTAGQTGAPQQAGIGAVARFVITSGSGYVQYTYGSFADIANNVATWTTWPKGTVNATAQDTTGYGVIVRFVCVTGTVVAILADASESEFPANVLIPWESMQPSYAYRSSGVVAGLLEPSGQVLPVLTRRPRLILKRMTDEVGVTYANSGTPAVVTVDTASPFGTSAIKLAIPTGNTYTDISYNGNTIANFDDHVVWRVWIENANHVSQIQTFAGTSGFSRLYQRTYNVSNSNSNLFNGEHFIAAGPMCAAAVNTFLTGVDTLADNRLRIFYNGAGATVNVWVERVVIHGNQNPTIVFSLDDCVVSHYTRAYPKLAAAGIPGVFGINSGDIGGSASLYLSSAQILEMANNGMEIYGHNVTNTNYPTQNAATYTAAYKTGLNALTAITPKAMSLYHPWVQGGNGTDVQTTMIAQGVQILRGIQDANSGPMNFFGDGVGARRVSIRANETHLRTLTALKTDVDNCIRYGGTMFFMTHEIIAGESPVGVETPASVWNGLVDYVASLRGQLQTPGIASLYDQWRAAGYISQ